MATHHHDRHLLHTTVLPVLASGDLFPEQKLPGMQVTEDTVAVCVSGGGSRAFTCALGLLRGLNDIDFLQKTRYLCAVSGGSWASSIFTFSTMDETTLLGPSLKPSDLTMDALKQPKGLMSTAVSSDNFRPFETAIKLYAEGKTDLDVLWETTIGLEILKPFGLDKMLFAYNEETVEDIVKRNNFLKKDDFVISQPGRPFLVMNGTLNGPVDSDTVLSPLQMTPLYTGCPYYQKGAKVSYFMPGCCCGLCCCCGVCTSCHLCSCCGLCPHFKKYIVGGGFVETFSFGCKQPRVVKDQFGGPCQCSPPDKNGLFKLERAVGISSAAFALIFKEERYKFDFLGPLGPIFDPVEYYWPVLSDKLPGPQRAIKFNCGDGGNFENTGLLSALQRGIRKAVVLISTSVKLFNDPDLKGIPDLVPNAEMDDQLTGLFGIAQNVYEWDYTENQVFPKEALDVVLQKMQTSYANGLGAFAHVKLPLLANSFWNIHGGYDVEIIFLYNENALNFRNSLPTDTRDELKKKEQGRFHNYPQYALTDNNGIFNGYVALYIEQINLLAATIDWEVKQHLTSFMEMLGI